MAAKQHESTASGCLNRPTLPQLLYHRQVHGIESRFNPHKVQRLSCEELSSRIAWNPKRMQNMILCVGPGTPASDFYTCTSSESSASISNEEIGNDDSSSSASTSGNDDVVARPDRSQVVVSQLPHHLEEEANSHAEESDFSFQDFEPEDEPIALRTSRHYLRNAIDGEKDAKKNSIKLRQPRYSGHVRPSLRHQGCINTASWLDCPWRLAVPQEASDGVPSPVSSNEAPTQLVTSGDDCVVKFWDVRHTMGTSNPLPGGTNTICPFSTQTPSMPPISDWERYTSGPQSKPIDGSVIRLTELRTRHRGNVFHVTPLHHEPGKIATCAADGFLLIADIATKESSVVVSPDQDFGHPLFSRHYMCFSHHFIDAHTGLLCSERGLQHFDIRLPPREQQPRSLLNHPGSCKACAVWSTDTVESAYVFAGGASADVSLYDLRMISDGSRSKVVQLYRPKRLGKNRFVSVSGIDISKDKREFLVSYENDQIYTFPILPNSSCIAGPTVDQLDEMATEGDDEQQAQNELSCYGAHLNRFTFLKNAKYAGPKDEYICTGSDSGHAWIYEKATGEVAAFMHADSSTCNGVLPHPTLPFFVTFGIDSTAKLWRATLPVDGNVDDSPIGRARFSSSMAYVSSTVVENWAHVKERFRGTSEESDEETYLHPEEFPSRGSLLSGGIFGGLENLFVRHSLRPPRETKLIANDLHNLPEVLRQNLFVCVEGKETGDDEPVRSNLNDLKQRIRVMRLKHQADQRGLLVNSFEPLALSARDRLRGNNMLLNNDEDVVYGAEVDCIPSSPCDWMPYDPRMTHHQKGCGPNFNEKDYEGFYRLNYHLNLLTADTWSNKTVDENSMMQSDIAKKDNSFMPASPVLDACERRKILLHKISLLKEGGSAALKAGCPNLAARRYDQAIQYCAAAYLNGCVGASEKDPFLVWGPLLKFLVTSRLNLSLVLLKSPINDAAKAAEQASLALDELAPFTVEVGKIYLHGQVEFLYSEKEAPSTYKECKELEAKAYYRLGASRMDCGDYGTATKNFEDSVKSTQALDCQPDRLVLRLLAEAKRENAREKKRQRKKYKVMFQSDA